MNICVWKTTESIIHFFSVRNDKHCVDLEKSTRLKNWSSVYVVYGQTDVGACIHILFLILYLN